MTTNDLVSVIVPVYNAEIFIEDTINSVFKQTYKNIEIVIVNDGSSDRTEEIIKKWTEQKKIKYIFQTNKGVSIARNEGVKYSKGNFVAFLDADDVWLPENIERKVEALQKDHNVGLVHANMQVVDHLSYPVGRVKEGKEGDVLDDLLLWNGCVIPTPSSILVRKEVFELVGEFDPELSNNADQDFFIRVAAKYKIGKLNEVLGLYRVHEENMHKNIRLMEKDTLTVYKKAKKNKLFKSFGFQQKCFSNMYLILAGSWWKDGNNKLKALYYFVCAIFSYPFNILKIFRKIHIV